MPCDRKHIEAIEAAASALSTQDDRVIFGHDDLLALISASLAAADEGPWRSMDSAPSEGETFLAVVDGVVRKVAWTKTSHVPLWGWCLVDQGVEDRDFCEPSLWMPLPAAPERKIVEANAASDGGDKEAGE